MAIGNGLRPDIWTEFQTRFNIPRIGEFYGATEGNVGLMNTFNKTGAVGYEPPVGKPVSNTFGLFDSPGTDSPSTTQLSPLAIVRFNFEEELPVRDPKTGFCIPCQVGEVGELLGFIDPQDSLRMFKGYTSKEATERKVPQRILAE